MLKFELAKMRPQNLVSEGLTHTRVQDPYTSAADLDPAFQANPDPYPAFFS
jgi:hypothetical protein